MQAYDEVAGVLDELRAAGVPIVVCSNWDWDLREAVEAAGLTDRVDVMVSSAWAGARKPHPRIFRRTLEAARITEGSGLVFVGDTWGPDVEGPLAMGMRPLYLRRLGHWPDATCPHDDPSVRPEVSVIEDLRGVLEVALHRA
jgi:putative hydrolase of the HAD superfamily